MKSDPPARGGAGRGQGRKPLSHDAPTVPVSIKMTLNQRDKLQRLGGPSWVRERINEAPEPTLGELRQRGADALLAFAQSLAPGASATGKADAKEALAEATKVLNSSARKLRSTSIKKSVT